MRKVTAIIVMLLMIPVINSYAQNRDGKRDGQGQQDRRGQQMDPNDRSDFGKRGDGAGPFRRQAMQDLKRFERLRMMKLLDLLDLDRKTEDKFIPHMREHQRETFKLMKKHEHLINKLGEGLKENKLSDNEIEEMIREINNLEKERNQQMVDFLIKSKAILTMEQLGKMYVFQARFGAEVIEKMRDFRNQQQGMEPPPDHP
ncbi:MAG: hypothetical protein DWP97_06340 [Calditrichaeota bacterium]|nr:MAG: hypothetical protein DWP97_06340 [Calditrichota bacterium]